VDLKLDEFISTVDECCNDVQFSFRGKPSGITPEVKDGIKTFHVWYGTNLKEYSSIQDVVNDPFFDGQSLREIYCELDIWFS
jgi:hypothetical protein